MDQPRVSGLAEYPALEPHLRALRATGLLASLDEERAVRVLCSLFRPRFSDDLLATLIEEHLREAPGEDIVLHHGDYGSAALLEDLLKRSFSGVLWDDAERGYVHLAGRGCMRPKGPRAWQTVFEAALALVGDPRHFVTLFVPNQFDEPMYLLVTEPQARALARLRLLRKQGAGKMPAAIPGREATPPSVAALVEELTRKGVRAKAKGARIVVELALSNGESLVSRVIADRGGGE